MIRFVLKRILLMIPVLIFVMAAVFTLMYFAPGDPARTILGDLATEDEVEAKRHELGLDLGYFERMAKSFSGILTGDFGISYTSGRPVMEELAPRVGVTAGMALLVLAFSGAVGIPLGAASARRRGASSDAVFRIASLLGMAIPSFYLALTLILIFSVKLALLPVSGLYGARYYILPVVSISAVSISMIARTTRSAMLDAYGLDFIRTARAKGISEARVAYRHCLRNSLVPIAAIMSVQFASALGGAVVNEQIFAIPGLAKLMVDAVLARNYPVVEGACILLTLMQCAVNLLADILYAALDPRVRLGERRSAKGVRSIRGARRHSAAQRSCASAPKERVRCKRTSRKRTRVGAHSAWRRFRRDRAAMAALCVFALIVLIAVFAPLISRYGYDEQDYDAVLEKPSRAHMLGTDEFGRDVFSRVVYASRASLLAGFASLAAGAFAGSVIGLVAGYMGGAWDDILMRICDALQAIPRLVLAVAIAGALGFGMTSAVIAVAVSSVPSFARVVRASAIKAGASGFVLSLYALGIPDSAIMRRHILPNVLSAIIVQATLGIGTSILLLASLSFLGLGVQPPTPEWGAMLSSARTLMREYPHLVIAPGAALMLTVFSLNLIGDGVRDAIDPRMR